MSKYITNINIMNDEIEQEYEYENDTWETRSFNFESEDETFNEIIDEISVKAYVRDEPIIFTCLKTIEPLPQPISLPVEEKFQTPEEMAEINNVRSKLTWCIPQKISENYDKSDDDSDDESGDEIQRKIIKIDLNYPTIQEANRLKSKKPKLDHSSGWINIGKETVTKILANPIETGKLLRNTQMCLYGEKCKRKSCRFAHRPEDLVVGDCLYKDHCRFVSYRNGFYVNNSSGDKMCKHLHPEEKLEDFYVRTNLKKRGIPSEDEMQKAFEEFIEPVKIEKPATFFRPSVWKPIENIQNKPKKAILQEAQRPSIVEDIVTYKIKEKNNISVRKREIKNVIERKEETIIRLKNSQYLSEFNKKQIEKLKIEIQEYEKELKELEDRLNIINSMTKLEKVQKFLPIVEIVPEKVINRKNVTSPGTVLELMTNKKEMDNSESEPVKELPTIQLELPMIPIPQEKVDETGWISVKTKPIETTKRTRMCSYGKDCRRKVCLFAHTKTELRICPCSFGNECKHVAITGKGFVNVENMKMCMYKHPSEHINNFYYRVGIDKLPVRTQRKM